MSEKAIHTALHERVAQQILRDIKGLSVGDKLEPMRDLARRHAVSLVTAREALLLLERDGWLRVRPGCGCYIARPQVSDRHIAILVELDILQPGVSPYFHRVVNRLRQSLSSHKRSFRLHIGCATVDAKTVGDPTSHGFMEDLENDHVSGVLAVATAPRASLVDPLKARGIPIVGMDSIGAFNGTVCMDYGGMLRLGAESLIAQGCRKLARIGGLYQNYATGRILDDFEKTILAHGLRCRREWSRTAIHPGRRGAGWDDFRELWNAHREKPDGLLVADDMMLADVAAAIHELRIEVPRQLKVVLATSQGIPHHAPFPLRRIENNPETVADNMVGLLFDLMACRAPRECELTVGYCESKQGQVAVLRERV